jgi:CspA family cold shock protein
MASPYPVRAVQRNLHHQLLRSGVLITGALTIALLGMPTGRVKFFNTDRGFGFILPDDGGPDVVLHAHDVEAAGMKLLVADQLVVYELGPARDGRLKAVNLRLL